MNLASERGFTITELLVGLLIASFLVAAVFLTFSRSKSTFDRKSAETDVQRRAKIAMQRLEQIFKEAGTDPCRVYYWDNQEPSQNGYFYAPLHPFRVGPALAGLSFLMNPFQALIVHTDEIDTGTEGQCDSAGQQVTDNLTLTHRAPSSARLIFVNALPGYASAAPFDLSCNNFGERHLISVPIEYDNTIPGTITIDCNNGNLISDEIECLYFEYLVAKDQEGSCPLGTSDDGTMCKIVDNDGSPSYAIPDVIRQIERVRVNLTLRSKSIDKAFQHPAELTACNQDLILASGIDLTGQPYPTVTVTNVFSLSTLRYRE